MLKVKFIALENIFGYKKFEVYIKIYEPKDFYLNPNSILHKGMLKILNVKKVHL